MRTFKATLEDRTNSAQAELRLIHRLQAFQDEFPDIGFCEHGDHGNVPCTQEVNSIATEVEFRNPYADWHKWIEAWPSTTIDGVKIYSRPACFRIAEANEFGKGYVPNEGWEAAMASAGIPQNIIQQVRAHLAEDPPVNCTKRVEWTSEELREAGLIP